VQPEAPVKAGVMESNVEPKSHFIFILPPTLAVAGVKLLVAVFNAGGGTHELAAHFVPFQEPEAQVAFTVLVASVSELWLR